MGVAMQLEAFLLRLVLGAMVVTSVACSSASPDPKHPGGEPIGASLHVPDENGSLPRYFTVEVRADGLWLDGERVDDSEIDALLETAANDPGNRGAAVILYATEPPAGAVLARVARSGFTHVVVSGLSAQAFDGLAQELGGGADEAVDSPRDTVAVAPAPVSPPKSEAAAAPTVEQTSAPDDVEVKHYGLHIGGGPNTDEERAKYLVRIEPHFDELRECHLLAKKRSVQASFGVDLLIGAKGGRPKVQDYRTRLDGKDFHMCVLGVLGNVSFPAPPRPTVVSYSVLFKPAK